MNKLKRYLEITDNNGNVVGSKTACIVMAHRKGGTGKTTNALSLAYTYAQNGLRTLLIDMDPQASSTQLLGINKSPQLEDDPQITKNNISEKAKEDREWLKNNPIYEIDDLYGYAPASEKVPSEFHGLSDLINQTLSVYSEYPNITDIKEAMVRPTFIETSYDTKNENGRFTSYKNEKKVEFGFDLLPSSEELLDDELFMSSGAYEEEDETLIKKKKKQHARINVLKYIVDVIKNSHEYDVIVIDTGPSLGFMTLNSISASDGIIVNAMPEKQSTLSLNNIKSNVRDIKSIDKTQKPILGVMMSAVDARSNTFPIICRKIKEELKLYVFNSFTSKSIAASNANSFGITLAQMNNKYKTTYENIAEEVLVRWKDSEEWELERDSRIQAILNSSVNLPEYIKLKETVKDEILKEIPANTHIEEELIEQITITRTNVAYERNVIKKMYSEGKLWKPHTTENMVKELNRIKKEAKSNG